MQAKVIDIKSKQVTLKSGQRAGQTVTLYNITIQPFISVNGQNVGNFDMWNEPEFKMNEQADFDPANFQSREYNGMTFWTYKIPRTPLWQRVEAIEKRLEAIEKLNGINTAPSTKNAAQANTEPQGGTFDDDMLNL